MQKREVTITFSTTFTTSCNLPVQKQHAKNRNRYRIKITTLHVQIIRKKKIVWCSFCLSSFSNKKFVLINQINEQFHHIPYLWFVPNLSLVGQPRQIQELPPQTRVHLLLQMRSMGYNKSEFSILLSSSPVWTCPSNKHIPTAKWGCPYEIFS